MIPSRPLLYVSLPSLAIILGLVWFRRKKSVQCDTGGDSIASTSAEKTSGEVATNAFTDLKQTKSLPISSPSFAKSNYNGNRSNSSSSSSSCSVKSDPIDIIPNTRSPPKLTDQQIDSELLKLKIQESDIKNLRSIEEQDDCYSESPIDLPGSVERRKNFAAFNKSFEPEIQPIIVKANMTAKVSPKNSFATECIKSDMEARENEKNRDSANHSPVEEDSESNINKDSEDIEENSASRNPPVASPPLSLCSLHSGDSGKGSSPPHSEGAPTTSYEFLLPTYLVSKILGRKAAFAQQIKAKTGASILIKRNPDTHKSKICSLEGTQAEIDTALLMIRRRIPEKRYPAFTLQRIYVGQMDSISSPMIDTSCIHLHLVEGINNDVTISAIINGGQVFLQQPLHPSFPSLNVLQSCMNQSYSMTESPLLPEITEDAVCVVPLHGNWYRVQIVSYNPENESCVVKYLDYGGYVSVSSKNLRQIRTDFMNVPFQSNECLLSNLKPVDDEGWSPDAVDILYNLTKGLILQAQVAGYSSDGLPEVFLYASLSKDNVIFINRELVARGLAEWVEDSS